MRIQHLPLCGGWPGPCASRSRADGRARWKQPSSWRHSRRKPAPAWPARAEPRRRTARPRPSRPWRRSPPESPLPRRRRLPPARPVGRPRRRARAQSRSRPPSRSRRGRRPGLQMMPSSSSPSPQSRMGWRPGRGRIRPLRVQGQVKPTSLPARRVAWRTTPRSHRAPPKRRRARASPRPRSWRRRPPSRCRPRLSPESDGSLPNLFPWDRAQSRLRRRPPLPPIPRQPAPPPVLRVAPSPASLRRPPCRQASRPRRPISSSRGSARPARLALNPFARRCPPAARRVGRSYRPTLRHHPGRPLPRRAARLPSSGRMPATGGRRSRSRLPTHRRLRRARPLRAPRPRECRPTRLSPTTSAKASPKRCRATATSARPRRRNPARRRISRPPLSLPIQVRMRLARPRPRRLGCPISLPRRPQ